MDRDRRQEAELKAQGWAVIRAWERDLQEGTVEELAMLLAQVVRSAPRLSR